jgi:GNAT superfamily N-acetyltransferase
LRKQRRLNISDFKSSSDMGKLPRRNILIRIAKPTDSDAVGALLASSYSSLLGASYDSEKLSRALPHITKANPALLSCGTYYVAETDTGNVVGCGGWTAEKPGSGEITEGEAHIRHFAVHPQWVRRGIGTSLLARCFNDARSLGIRKLHCLSTLNAVRFYEAFGFDAVGPVDVRLEPALTIPCILMTHDFQQDFTGGIFVSSSARECFTPIGRHADTPHSVGAFPVRGLVQPH